jgi:hypothetical protein
MFGQHAERVLPHHSRQVPATASLTGGIHWIGFGGPVIRSGDLVEQEKSLKYASLVANAIMLSNVVDMSAALAAMAEAGEPVTPDLVAALSPYGREHIRRFGQYVLDMEDLPAPLDPRPLPFAPAS